MAVTKKNVLIRQIFFILLLSVIAVLSIVSLINKSPETTDQRTKAATQPGYTYKVWGFNNDSTEGWLPGNKVNLSVSDGFLNAGFTAPQKGKSNFFIRQNTVATTLPVGLKQFRVQVRVVPIASLAGGIIIYDIEDTVLGINTSMDADDELGEQSDFSTLDLLIKYQRGDRVTEESRNNDWEKTKLKISNVVADGAIREFVVNFPEIDTMQVSKMQIKFTRLYAGTPYSVQFDSIKLDGMPLSSTPPPISTSISPVPSGTSCIPKPTCLSAKPPCAMPEPIGGWCGTGSASVPGLQPPPPSVD